MPNLIQKTISMPCHPRFLREVRTLLHDTLSQTRIRPRKRAHLILAIDETVSSILNYAKFKGYDHEISLSIEVDDVRFKAIINDTLNVFDLNGGLTRDELTERINKEKAYTMGLFITRQIMDEINYSYKKGFENSLQMISFL